MDIRAPRKRWFGRVSLSYGQKVFLLASVPLVLAATAIAMVVNLQAKALAKQEIALLEERLLTAKQSELANYMSLARTSIQHIYGNAQPDDEAAKTRVMQVLAAMNYGTDGFFFVYDYDGTNLVSSKQTYLINRNWTDIPNSDGEYVVRRLIEIARQGGGVHRYDWPKPSTGQTAEMLSYVVGLQDWRWAVGTGIWIDDVVAQVQGVRAEAAARIRSTFVLIALITLAALLLVFVSGLYLNLRERRLADAKLKALTQRIFDTQEEERGRVARELHDGISQLLVGVRYGLDTARRRLRAGQKIGDGLDASHKGLNDAIQEVRRISRDLRPGILDDLGLGPALKAMVDEFGVRTGIKTEFETVVFRNRLAPEAKTALFRVAQEALTNIERHANAGHVHLRVWGHRHGASLRISDDGVGLEEGNADRHNTGLGLRNMAERIEHLDGELRITSTAQGTLVEANLPLKHLLPPGTGPRESTQESEAA